MKTFAKSVLILSMLVTSTQVHAQTATSAVSVEAVRSQLATQKQELSDLRSALTKAEAERKENVQIALAAGTVSALVALGGVFFTVGQSKMIDPDNTFLYVTTPGAKPFPSASQVLVLGGSTAVAGIGLYKVKKSLDVATLRRADAQALQVKIAQKLSEIETAEKILQAAQ